MPGLIQRDVQPPKKKFNPLQGLLGMGSRLLFGGLNLATGGATAPFTGVMQAGADRLMGQIGQGGGDQDRMAQEEYLRRLQMQRQAAFGGGYDNPWADPGGMDRLRRRY